MMIALAIIASVGIAAIAYAIWATVQLRAEERDVVLSGELAQLIVDSWMQSYPAVPYTYNKPVVKEVGKMKKRIMIDLETMAVTKDAAIIQLGATVFKPTTPEYQGDLKEFIGPDSFGMSITLESCLAAGLVTDQSTTAWWERPEQIEAFRTTQAGAIPLRDALLLFRTWCLADTDPEDIEPWANGTSFDLAILETAYRKLGLPIPWKFYNERDYRTMKSLYRDVTKPPFEGTKHNAADDAVNQALHLIAIMQFIDRVELADRVNALHTKASETGEQIMEAGDYAI